MRYFSEKHIGLFLLCITILTSTFGQEKTSALNQDEELGKVSWYRDYDEALKLAKEQDKSVLILFQEVPGCATCRNYGHNVLSHPLMTQVIENLFIPLVIYNNKGKKDKLILQKFKEPSWNNPVVRIINTQEKDIVKRLASDYSAIGLYKAMENALKAEKKSIPDFMKLLGEELTSHKTGNIKETYFKMYCFWTGEKHLGSADGVLSTEAGFIGHNEVVKVRYDSKTLDKKYLLKYAAEADFFPIANNDSYKVSDKDKSYYLQHTDYKYIPMTELQRTKINSALGKRQSPRKYLSPQQIAWLNDLKKSSAKREILYNKNVTEAWAMMK